MLFVSTTIVAFHKCCTTHNLYHPFNFKLNFNEVDPHTTHKLKCIITIVTFKDVSKLGRSSTIPKVKVKNDKSRLLFMRHKSTIRFGKVQGPL